MYYHASPTPGIAVLEPRVSNHGRPLLYFSEKRENVLVYLSNAIETFCRETGFAHTSPWQKWGPYGFTKDGRLQIQEYYPNALVETYAGVPGYIYAVADFPRADFDVSIPFAAVSETPVPVASCELAPDALEAILKAEREGLITVLRYAENRDRIEAFNRRTIPGEYREAAAHPEYRYFLKAKFGEILRDYIE